MSFPALTLIRLVLFTRFRRNSKKYTFDKCVKAQVPCEPDADVREFADTVTGLVADACAGRNTALFTASVAKSMAQHERTSIFLPLVKELGKRKKHFSISYGFFGITDSALVNLISEKNVPVARICANMGPLLTELIDFDELNAILEKGCMLPHFLLLQLEARSSPKTLGTLCMMDLANPCYLQPTEPSYHISASSLTKSVAAFKKVAISLSTPGYIGTIPFHESLLTTIIAPFLGVNGHATVMLNLDVSC
ncbi:hypothetical protein BC830DRAFT_360715 [Chytriomyces sp. MP71]|nr:hypothetical protein BC830DRAFT_360715 [Chytriomyces sp. MP71]